MSTWDAISFLSKPHHENREGHNGFAIRIGGGGPVIIGGGESTKNFITEKNKTNTGLDTELDENTYITADSSIIFHPKIALYSYDQFTPITLTAYERNEETLIS